MTLREQDYRDFRFFYRGIKNRSYLDASTSLEHAARSWLWSKFGPDRIGSDVRHAAMQYLINGPRCDGDTLTIAGEG